MTLEQEKTQMQKLFEAQVLEEKEYQKQLAQMTEQPTPMPFDEKEDNNTKFELPTNQVNPAHIKALNKDFDDIYGSEKRSDGMYRFTSDAEATKFFQQQAQMGRSVLVKRAGEDSYMYSDDEGNFFKGTQDELQDFLNLQVDTAYQSKNVTPLSTKPQSSSNQKEEDDEKQMALGI